jgi:hypothetical protein
VAHDRVQLCERDDEAHRQIVQRTGGWPWRDCAHDRIPKVQEA